MWLVAAVWLWDNSTLTWKIYSGTCYYLYTFYTGEDGILPNVLCKLSDGKGKLVAQRGRNQSWGGVFI